MFLAGTIAAFGLLFLVFKLGWRKVVAYDIFFDILIKRHYPLKVTFFTKSDLLGRVGTVLVVVGMVPKRKQIHGNSASMNPLWRPSKDRVLGHSIDAP